MVAAMSIRAARTDDFPAIAAITNHYIATTAIHFGYEPVSADEMALVWSSHPEYPWLVIEATEVVGYAKAGVWRARAAYRWTAETGLYLAPEACGRGLGRRLYTALLDELAAREFHTVVAGITLPNDPSLALHRALGFTEVGVVRDAGFKHDHWHDVAFWQKALGTTAP
jgi:phosphinothricin acetyltransferase